MSGDAGSMVDGADAPTADGGVVAMDAAGHEPEDAGPALDAAAPADGDAEADASDEADAAEPDPRNFRPVYPLEAEFTEGRIYDDVDHAFYVGSLADGSVHRVDANTGLDELFFSPDEPGVWWTLGMAVDACCAAQQVHIRLPDGALTEVDIDGDFFDGLPPLSGADGMAWDGGSVLVAFTSQLNRITPVLGDWGRATSDTVDVPVGMTDVVTTPGGAYLLNGQAVDFAFDFVPDPFRLVRFDGDL